MLEVEQEVIAAKAKKIRIDLSFIYKMFFAFDYFLLLKLKKFLIFLKKTLKSTNYRSEDYFITNFRVDRFALSKVYVPYCNGIFALTSCKIIVPFFFAPTFKIHLDVRYIFYFMKKNDNPIVAKIKGRF